MTAEAVREGKIICDKNKYKQIVAFPGASRRSFWILYREKVMISDLFSNPGTDVPCTGSMCPR